jgi:hypothetical protein
MRSPARTRQRQPSASAVSSGACLGNPLPGRHLGARLRGRAGHRESWPRIPGGSRCVVRERDEASRRVADGTAARPASPAARGPERIADILQAAGQPRNAGGRPARRDCGSQVTENGKKSSGDAELEHRNTGNSRLHRGVCEVLTGLAKRRLVDIAAAHFAEEPVLVLNGPRTVGKSTLLSQLAERLGRTVIDCDDPRRDRLSALVPAGS